MLHWAIHWPQTNIPDIPAGLLADKISETDKRQFLWEDFIDLIKPKYLSVQTRRNA